MTLSMTSRKKPSLPSKKTAYVAVEKSMNGSYEKHGGTPHGKLEY